MDGYAVRAADLAAGRRRAAPGRRGACGRPLRRHAGTGRDGADLHRRRAAGWRRRHRAAGERQRSKASGCASRARRARQLRPPRRARFPARARSRLPPAGGSTARDLGFAAALNHAWLPVRRRPRVALARDRRRAGACRAQPLGADADRQLQHHGAGRHGRASGAARRSISASCRDDPAALAASRRSGCAASISSSRIGGASVGERDLVRSVLGEHGLELDFWQIAMRPGKPLMFGRIRGVPLLGLPGNPVSAGVCAVLFVRAAICVLLGLDPAPPEVPAVLGRALAAQRPAPGVSAGERVLGRGRPPRGGAGGASGQLDAGDLRARRLPDQARALRPGDAGGRAGRRAAAGCRARSASEVDASPARKHRVRNSTAQEAWNGTVDPVDCHASLDALTANENLCRTSRHQRSRLSGGRGQVLTQRQHQLLQFIQGYLGDHGVPPSFEEMRDALKLKSKSGIHRLITGLEERGYIRRLPYRARALEVIRLPANWRGGAGAPPRAALTNVVQGNFGARPARCGAKGGGTAQPAALRADRRRHADRGVARPRTQVDGAAASARPGRALRARGGRRFDDRGRHPGRRHGGHRAPRSGRQRRHRRRADRRCARSP